MTRAITIILFFIGFGAFLVFKFMAKHARKGWKAAKGAVEAIEGETEHNK